MTAENLIADLASRLSLPSLQLDEHRAYRLVFDNDLAIQIESPEGAEALHFIGVIGKVPSEDREEFYADLLDANLPSGESADEPRTALDAETDEALLISTVPFATATPDSAATALETLLNRLEAWRERLADAHQTAGEATTEEPIAGLRV